MKDDRFLKILDILRKAGPFLRVKVKKVKKYYICTLENGLAVRNISNISFCEPTERYARY